ncbi:hypothetical protein [Ideonella dechloratans]|uniref:hypothetical protein n=1 Tax=Ideonella dechloratans TaxID=36863 RepID=UPI0014781E53|nr:hypothetical protein [Ideonella dechloratans]UFU11668.1 hypothetical protein LRM40_08420 [Ideonella dechloratans]
MPSSPLPSHRPRASGTARRWLVWLGVVAVLATVFLAYLRPELALDLAGRLWACF